MTKKYSNIVQPISEISYYDKYFVKPKEKKTKRYVIPDSYANIANIENIMSYEAGSSVTLNRFYTVIEDISKFKLNPKDAKRTDRFGPNLVRHLEDEEEVNKKYPKCYFLPPKTAVLQFEICHTYGSCDIYCALHLNVSGKILTQRLRLDRKCPLRAWLRENGHEELAGGAKELAVAARFLHVARLSSVENAIAVYTSNRHYPWQIVTKGLVKASTTARPYHAILRADVERNEPSLQDLLELDAEKYFYLTKTLKETDKERLLKAVF